MRALGFTAALAIGFGFIVGGCTTQEVGRVGEQPRDQIRYAANATYPESTPQTSDRINVAAIDDPRANTLTLMNLSDNAIPPSTAWVNGAYVYQLPSIPPRGMVDIRYSQLLMAGPNRGDLKQANQSVRKVELQTQDGLYSVQGPSKKTR